MVIRHHHFEKLEKFELLWIDFFLKSILIWMKYCYSPFLFQLLSLVGFIIIYLNLGLIHVWHPLSLVWSLFHPQYPLCHDFFPLHGHFHGDEHHVLVFQVLF